jgi:dTDP-glucose pyrophosphorylase
MPDFYVDSLDISPSDFIEECSSSEITQLIEILIEDGYIDTKTVIKGDNQNPDDELFAQSLLKISEYKYRLTNEEEELINKIANRL